MPIISKDSVKSINNISLHRFIHGLEGSGMTLHGKCPKCGAEGKKKSKWQGLWVKDDDVRNKHIAGCNSCDFKAGGGAINVAMSLYDLEFVAACEYIAKETGFQIEYESEKKLRKEPAKTADFKHSFCYRQLQASGLEPSDVIVKAVDGDDQYTVCPFRPGRLDIFTGEVDEKGDEMLILYYDLEGRRKKCIPRKFKSREVPYTRIRWSIPDKCKYQTIAGAKSEIYFPQKIRDCYKSSTHIETLFIQEGEKKAEKACKHGIPSIAIQGIGNIGNAKDGLPSEIQYLVQRCSVKNIVFLMDADWQDLSSNIENEDSVEIRPASFARALIKFKKFIQTLALSKIYCDVWHAHINHNEAGDKGIDDILCNTLKGKEESLKENIDKAMISHDGKGEFVDIVNITSWSDSKIKDLWCLNNSEDFFKIHRERLEKIQNFKFNSIFYRIEGGSFTVATEYSSGKKFWMKTVDDKGKTKIECDPIVLQDFLISNGFRKFKDEGGNIKLVKIDNGIINFCDEYDVRNFVLEYINVATKDYEVKLYFYENIDSKLTNAALYRLDKLVTTAGTREQSVQRIYFRNSEVEIDSKDIKVYPLKGPVWEANLIKREFERVRIIESFKPDGAGSFIIRTTEDGERCEFLRFLNNTSNSWRNQSISQTNLSEFFRHLANKITAIGYLLRDYKTPSEKKAVVAMDAKMSEVGVSSGRTGKSFIGEAIEKFCSQHYIDGRKTTNDDKYMYTGVTRTTRNIFLDDINENFDFGKFYPSITGKLMVNAKKGDLFNIPFEEAPKLYITTNHALQNIDVSGEDRLVFMSFSDWYSSDYTPFMEFGHFLFDGWDDEQWLLFDNFMLECIMIYMRSLENAWQDPGRGVIKPPMDGLKRREKRREMGELFLSWAEIYFSEESGNIGSRIPRKEMFDSFLSEYGIKASQMSARNFRDKIRAFCHYAGFEINTHKRNEDGLDYWDFRREFPDKPFFGGRDISGSVEYYTVSKLKYYDGM